jgi:hypothetical protein
MAETEIVDGDVLDAEHFPDVPLHKQGKLGEIAVTESKSIAISKCFFFERD